MVRKEEVAKAAELLYENGLMYVSQALKELAENSESGEIELMDENASEKVVLWDKFDFRSAFKEAQVLYSEERYQEVLPDLKEYLDDHSRDFEAFQDLINDHFKPDNAEFVKDLWLEFGDVPMDPETERIKTAWHGFPKNTHREEIWAWFEETYHVRVYDLLYNFDTFDDSKIEWEGAER